MNRKFRRAITGAILLAALTSVSASARAADQDLVARGAYLVRAGDCISCHSMPGGKPYAGGAAMATPFGKLYAPNITPDKVTGLGAWSEDEFYRALHDGIGRKGEYLYPAFPYLYFTKVTREDVAAIKAYLDSLEPVNAPAQQNQMMFPFNLRAGISGWNAAFLHKGDFKADPAQSDQINRGAYLVEGLGHCADCHTPKNIAMAPDDAKAYAGGAIDNWYAPNITSDQERGIGRWSAQDLTTYLKTGTAPGKGVVVGPMAQVIHESLAYLTDQDLGAVVAYIKTIPPIADYTPSRPSALQGADAAGATLYLNNCAFCHQPNGQGIEGAVPALAGNDAVKAKGPENVIRVILGGHLASGGYAPMPAVGANLSDEDVAAITNYVRTAWSNAAPATADGGRVETIREATASFLTGRKTAENGGDPCFAESEIAHKVQPITDPNVAATLNSVTDSTMLNDIDTLLARLRSVAPDRPKADIVNGLTIAYCRVLAKAAGPQSAPARARLDRFSQLVYTRLSSGPKD